MSESTETAIYESTPMKRSWGMVYRVFPDRLELETRLQKTPIVIPWSDLEHIEVRPPFAIFDIARGRYTLKEMTVSVKLDFADLYRHVCVQISGRTVRQYRFTPDDPDAFVAAAEAARAEA